jgi:hypothetical protein
MHQSSRTETNGVVRTADDAIKNRIIKATALLFSMPPLPRLKVGVEKGSRDFGIVVSNALKV